MRKSKFYRPVSMKVLSDDWGKLTRHTFELKRQDGTWQQQTRETYDRGNGATCLLYNPENECVLLTRQFRLPVYINGHHGHLIETPAGLLEGEDPTVRMRAELVEETGYAVSELEPLFEIFMSPGSVTEYLAFYLGTFSGSDRVSKGGGEKKEGEDIEVMHVPLPEAMAMIMDGQIRDAKTVILLQHLALRHLVEVNEKKARF